MEYLTRMDIAKHLGIGESTLRRYITEMKNQGYSFSKLGKMEVYTNEDFLLFVKTKEYCYDENLPLVQVVELVLNGLDEVASSVEMILPHEQHSIFPVNPNEFIANVVNYVNDLKTKVDNIEVGQTELFEQNLEIKYGNEKILKGQDDIEKKIDKFESKRDEHLMMTFRLLQEQKKDNEEIKELLKQVKKSSWFKIMLIKMFRLKKAPVE